MSALTPISSTASLLKAFAMPLSSSWRRTACALAALGAMFLTATAPTHAATLTRTTAYEHDAGTGQVTKELTEPSETSQCLVNAYTYDTFGNRLTNTTRNCNGSSGEAAAPVAGSDALIAARTSASVYDASGRFPVTATNALNQSETRSYDARFGTMTALTGPNGLSTAWNYDGFGRKTKETRADGTTTTWEYLYCNGANGGTQSCPSIAGAAAQYLVRTQVKDSAGNQISPTEVIYYDVLDRAIRSQTQGFDGSIIYTDTEYNALGQVARVSRPYVAGTSATWTSFTYDKLGRQISETAPNGKVTTTSYNGLQTVVTLDPDGSGPRAAQSRTTLRNGIGQTVRVTDANGKSVAYTYDPQGNLLTTTDPLGNVVAMQYDLRGRKIALQDPDMGSWTYAYDVLGQLKRQTDGNSKTSTLSYDLLGRLVSRSEADLVSNWYYDKKKDGSACGKGIGKLCQSTAGNGYSKTTTYDTLGRASSTNTVIDTTYTASNSYDTAGRLATVTYPNNVTVRYAYSPLGYLQKVSRVDGSTGSDVLLWQANAKNAAGQLTSATLGNGLTVTRTYDSIGLMTAVSAAGASGPVHAQSFVFDLMGNLIQRSDTVNNVVENFAYDNLNRLLQSSGTNLVTRSFAYDDIGNITYKSDVGTYTYNASGANSVRPHAVARTFNAATAQTDSYTYDAAGNLWAIGYGNGNTRGVTYTSFNLPSQVQGKQNGQSYTYKYLYTPEHQRAKHIITRPDGTDTTIYLNDGPELFFEQETKPNGVIESKAYISAGNETIGMYVTKSAYGTGDGPQMRYFHKDHLGSIATVTNETGQVLERLAYEAFGERRYANGTAQDRSAPINGMTTDRGFTEHEHLDELNLIHMNGRIFDPVTARFMTPDPNVPDPKDSQSFNRYTYVLNNPLSLVDPTGFSDESSSDGNDQSDPNPGTSYPGGTRPTWNGSGFTDVPTITYDTTIGPKYGGWPSSGSGYGPYAGYNPYSGTATLPQLPGADKRLFDDKDIAPPIVPAIAICAPACLPPPTTALPAAPVAIPWWVRFAGWLGATLYSKDAGGPDEDRMVADKAREDAKWARQQAMHKASEDGANEQPPDRAENAGADSEKSDKPASEKMARDIAKRIERDLGKDARRDFHDAKENGAGDRTAEQLRQDARDLYNEAGKPIPAWLR